MEGRKWILFVGRRRVRRVMPGADDAMIRLAKHTGSVAGKAIISYW
jgi:hypothetical protein